MKKYKVIRKENTVTGVDFETYAGWIEGIAIWGKRYRGKHLTFDLWFHGHNMPSNSQNSITVIGTKWGLQVIYVR